VEFPFESMFQLESIRIVITRRSSLGQLQLNCGGKFFAAP
jgi:hypothetical protein